MSGISRIRVYMACSLDGYIAGPGDDLSFLPAPSIGAGDAGTGLAFDDFMSQVGALLMGRRTYDVVATMGQWPYGDLPTLVATSRQLEPPTATVRAVSGDIKSLVQQAIDAAAGRDVYLDGGSLVRDAIAAGLVDELCLSIVPVLLGDGVRLFERLSGATQLEFTAHDSFGDGMVQLTARVRR
jgi:dihydrofolate reductase